MRREIDTIRNELNTLKEVRGHPDDCYPPQGNQPSEQVENLQVGECLSRLQYFALLINQFREGET